MNIEQQQKEGGFTLVELAIVMIIIGLLIGGILKGQELIANSQVTATVAQIKGIEAGISTFRDKYRMLPGDMTTPGARLAGCSAAPCTTAGDANGRVVAGAAPGVAAPAIGDEGVVAFAHMAAANLVGGLNANSGVATPTFANELPEAKIGGGFWMAYSDGTLTNAEDAAPGHYLILHGVSDAAVAANDNSSLSASRAAQIDSKLDDGLPNTGSVRANVGNNTCKAGTADTDIYNSGIDNAGCSLYIRVQG